MATVPSKVFDRLSTGLKRFQPILIAAKARDAGEADTSTVVKDLLSEVFGYDKYAEITSEYLIKGTFCDLAVKLDGKLQILIEVKSIGLELKDAHLKQAIDYAANQGVEWVVLTNGSTWRIHRVIFGQPISQDLVFECDLLTLNPKNRSQVESLFLFAKEGQSKSVLDDYHAQRQATNRYFLGALVLSDPVVEVIRRELRRAFPEVRIGSEQLQMELSKEVLKREVTEGEKADDARRRISKAQIRALRARAKTAPSNGTESEVSTVTPEGELEYPSGDAN